MMSTPGSGCSTNMNAMESDLQDNACKLSSLNLEKTTIHMPKEITASAEKECKLSLVIKILSDKQTNFRVLGNTLELIWSFTQEFKLLGLGLGVNFFQVQFKTEADIEKVLQGIPWYFDNYLMIIKRWKPGIDDVSFNSTPIWIQLLNLSMHWTTAEAGEYICNYFGKALKAEVVIDDQTERKMVRCLTEFDLTKPLIRGTNVEQEGINQWVTFRYENVSYFCYYCGIIGHTNKFCYIKLMDQRQGIYKDELFGPELKGVHFKAVAFREAIIEPKYTPVPRNARDNMDSKMNLNHLAQHKCQEARPITISSESDRIHDELEAPIHLDCVNGGNCEKRAALPLLEWYAPSLAVDDMVQEEIPLKVTRGTEMPLDLDLTEKYFLHNNMDPALTDDLISQIKLQAQTLPSATTKGCSGSGEWKPVNPKDPHMVEITKFAIDYHNQHAETRLKLKKVIKATTRKEDTVSEYCLILKATSVKGRHHYRVVVLERPKIHFLQLLRFSNE